MHSYDRQRDARRSNLWEMKQLRTFPDGKAFPAQIYENPATAPVWPQNLFDLTATDRPAVNFKAELIGKSVRNAPVSFIVVSQKRILVQVRKISIRPDRQKKSSLILCLEHCQILDRPSSGKIPSIAIIWGRSDAKLALSID